MKKRRKYLRKRGIDLRFEVINRVIKRDYEDYQFLIGDNADYKAVFSFDEEWDGHIKTARFISNGKCVEQILDNDECIIPLELLKSGTLKVGVFTSEMATTPCEVSIKASIKQENGTTAEPTPDVYAQIIKMLENIEVQGVTDEQLERAISNYLTEHPVEGLTEEDVINIINSHKEELKGVDGVSPTVTVTKEGNTATITCTDVNGTTTATITDGKDGKDGKDGTGGGSSIYYDCTEYGVTTDNEDNTPAFQTLIDTIYEAGGGTIYIPNGTYNFKPVTDKKCAMLAKSNVSVIGENIEKTVLKCIGGNPFSLFYAKNTSRSPTTGATYSNFTVDAYQTGNTNKVYGKAFFYQYVKNCVFRDLILKGTVATALGIDFLDNVLIENVNCIDCGRTFISESGTSGTSGIGIGTGGFQNENFFITNCVCVNSGQYGIFIENQHTLGWGGNTDNSKGSIISNCTVRNGLFRGIGVRGGTHIIVSDCNSYENAKEGIYLDNLCKNVKISGCNSVNNSQHGILVNCNSNSEDVIISDNNVNGNTGNGIDIAVATSGLALVGNVTKGNTTGLVFESGKEHTDTIIKANAFMDSTNAVNSIFKGNTAFNDLYTSEVIECTGITLDNSTLSFTQLVPVKLTATIEPENYTEAVTWESSDNTIATVDADGLVTPVANGECDITVKCGSQSAMCHATVSVNSDIVTLENADFNSFDNWQSGEYTSNTDASFVTNASRICLKGDCEYLKVEVGRKYTFTFAGTIGDGDYAPTLTLRWLDNAGKFISSSTGICSKKTSIFVPATASYVKVSMYTQSSKTTYADYEEAFTSKGLNITVS